MYFVGLTLALIFMHDWLESRIAFLRGALYALILIMLMLNRPQGLLGRHELDFGRLLRRVRRAPPAAA